MIKSRFLVVPATFLLAVFLSAPLAAQTVEFETVPVAPAADSVPGEGATDPVASSSSDTSSTGARGEPLRIGVEPRPPYAVETDAGWTGIAVDGWRLVAERLGLAYEWVPLAAGEGVDALEAGRVDLALPIDATPSRAERVAFTAPLHTATIGVAGGPSRSLTDIAFSFLDWTFLRVIIGIAMLLLVVGAIVWLLERRKNSDMFHPSTARGLGDGFWWAGVTLTTIGYGDKAPATPGGRAVAMVWMLLGLAVSAALTATIVSATGVGGDRQVSLPEDLRGLRVAAEPDTASARYLDAAGIPFEPTDDIDAALRAVADEELDAVLALSPLIEERVGALDLDVPTARSEREPHLVAFAHAPDATFARDLDRAVLATVTAPGWGDVLARYLER